MARATKLTKRAKTAGKATNAAYAKKILGTERQEFPEHDPLTDMQVGGLLYWYNLTKNPSDAKDYLLSYLKDQNDNRYSDVSKTTEKLIRPTAGWLARMVSLGLILSNQQRDTFERLIDDSIKRKPVVDDSETPSTPAPTTVVKKSGLDILSIIGDIERAVDAWRTAPFSLTTYLTERKLSPAVCEPVIAFYGPLVSELQTALEGKQKDLREAYAYLTKADLRKYLGFIVSIVDDAKKYGSEYVESKVVNRKPRKKKEIPLDKKVELLQYLPEFLQARVRSIDPKKIIGAKELWTFDSVSKRLIVLRAKTDAGLDLHRSTIINFDEKDSAAKRIGRQTSRILETILISPRQRAREVFDTLNGDRLEITGRINKNTVLLKTFVK